MLTIKRSPRERTAHELAAHEPAPHGMSNAGVPYETDSATDFVMAYKRRLLTFVGASDDVNLNHVFIYNEHVEAHSYSEYNHVGEKFAINVAWREKTPARHGDQPDNDGLYARHGEIGADALISFLDSLEGTV